MRIGAYTLTIVIPASRSLKDKRRVIKGIKDRLKARYNIAIAEVDYQDLWQRSTIAIVSVSNDEAVLNGTFSRIRNEIEGIIPGNVIEEEITFF